MSIRRLRVGDALQYRQLMLEGYERHPDAFTSSASERAVLPVGNTGARLLYERCGFVQFGLELAVAVGSSFVSKVHMWCDLKCRA